jgi:ABC-type antimicrobial peptide transport system permease subunit
MSIWNDVRYSIRSFARSPLSTVALVLTIGLGVGGNAAVDGFIRGLSTVTLASEMTPETAAGLARISALLRAVATAVFVIACANVASLLLSRASARSRETSVRVALGASRAQLTRHVLADSMVVAVAGGAVGVLLTAWTTMLVPVLSFAEDAEQLVFSPDAARILLVIAIGILLTMASGALPLFELRHDQPSRALQREDAGSSTRMRVLSGSLVMMQLALCCVLIVSMAVLEQGLDAALETRVSHRLGMPILVTAQPRVRDSPFETAEAGLEYFQRVERAARSAGPIFDAAWVARPPGSRLSSQPVRIEPPDLPTRELTLEVVAVTPELLRGLKMPPVRGRMFGRGDIERCSVAVVNEQAADLLFDGDPVGRRVTDTSGHHVEIIGVVSTLPASADVVVPPQIFFDAVTHGTPLQHTGPSTFRVPMPSETAVVMIETNAVSANYFSAMNLPLVTGRTLSDDDGLGKCRVGVINQVAADRYFGGHALGGALIDPDGRRTEVVGIVSTPLLRATQREVEPTMFTSMMQDFVPRMTMLLGTRTDIDDTLSSVRRQVGAVEGTDDRFPILVRTLDSYLASTALAPERIATTLTAAAAAIALGLGIFGLSGAMADAARTRRRETALRVALGAPAWRIAARVFVDGARLAAGGLMAGAIAAFFVARWVTQITGNEQAIAWWVWLLAPAVLVAAVAVASVFPARDAMAVDPLSIMRDK